MVLVKLGAYRHYSALKKIRQQPTEVWGKALNKSAVETSVKSDEQRAPEKNPMMSGIGKKLLANASFSASNLVSIMYEDGYCTQMLATAISLEYCSHVTSWNQSINSLTSLNNETVLELCDTVHCDIK